MKESNNDKKRNEVNTLESAQNEPTPSIIMSASEKKWCKQTIRALRRNKYAVAFNQPVDPVFYNIPDYFDIIKRPMDLGTVEKKLSAGKYVTMDQFKEDIELVFDNCYLYNNPGDPVTQDAKRLEEQYHKHVKKEPTRLTPAMTTNGKVEPTVTSTSTVSSNATITSNDNTVNPQKTDTIYPSQPQQSTPPDTVMTNTTTSSPVPTSAKPLQVKLSLRANNKESPLSSQKSINEQQQRKMPDDQYKRCEAIVKELKKPRHQHYNWPFREPVNTEITQATDYYDVIKNPMDMSTYEKKLYDNQYTHQDELIADIRLMFQNCYAYNPPGHLVHKLGKEFEVNFEKQWKKLLARTSGDGQKGTSNSSSVSTKNVKKRKTSDIDTEYIPSAADEGSPSAHQLLPTNKHKPHTTAKTIDDSLSDALNSNNNSSAIATTDNATVITSTSSDTATSENKEAISRPILRLKLSVKPKDDKKEEDKPNPAAKASGLALSKELPNPKLAINNVPPAANEKRADVKKASNLNGNRRTALAISKPQSSQVATAIKKASSPPTAPPPKPKEPALPAFDINAVYNQIHNEKKLKEQQKREEQEKWERNERIRLEKERIASEERMKQLREFNQHLQAKRQQDKVKRLNALNTRTINISNQKVTLTKFEHTIMMRDKDWHDMCDWQKQTIDYRHIPTPGFVKRAPLKVSEIRARLLSKQGRLRSQTSSQADSLIEDDGGSDMDID
ncbi:Bromodomain-containing protein [Mycotypha africana]|uniref:Bromodomain-containing protein n=1 Tax=Mycotypha africana TaxID=64632 RepID=UPI002300EB22|nr:Bromodomain-containing protein [Mycotypha africana]KAI8969102.1 Bromodomain-containing protein [Mycotypha africana]